LVAGFVRIGAFRKQSTRPGFTSITATGRKATAKKRMKWRRAAQDVTQFLEPSGRMTLGIHFGSCTSVRALSSSGKLEQRSTAEIRTHWRCRSRKTWSAGCPRKRHAFDALRKFGGGGEKVRRERKNYRDRRSLPFTNRSSRTSLAIRNIDHKPRIYDVAVIPRARYGVNTGIN